MDDNEIEAEVEQPIARLHDRWSLLALGVGAVHDMMETATMVMDVAAGMALEHMRQKRYDRKFMEIVK